MKVRSLAPVVAAFALSPVSAMAATGSQNCDGLKSLALQSAKIDSVASVAAGDFTPPGARAQALKNLPAFCRVAATLKPSSDSNIKIEVWLPANWNGKFQAVGNGGWAGTISYPALAAAIRSGYAATSTDTGHTSEGGEFVKDHPEQFVDFAYRSEHEMTVKGKAITAAYYGRAASHSYWNGCSTGGRQGLMEARRYPDDFDGIIAGDPANPRSVHDSWALAVTVATHKDAASAIPTPKFSTIHKAAVAACDMLDGVKDGLVENPKACHFDPASLVCKGADSDACLTPKQVQTAKAVMSPQKVNGKDFYPGLEPTSEMGWEPYIGTEVNPRAVDNFRYVVLKDPNWSWQTFDAGKTMVAAEKADREESVAPKDLDAFFKRNGKLILYHGWSDPQIAPQGTINFYHETQAMLGGPDKASQQVRLFMVPGMGHCRGGEGTDTFDMVPAMDAWVTQKVAPTQVKASKVEKGETTRTRPLCLFPQVASWKGTGSSDQAENFVCKAP